MGKGAVWGRQDQCGQGMNDNWSLYTWSIGQYEKVLKRC